MSFSPPSQSLNQSARLETSHKFFRRATNGFHRACGVRASPQLMQWTSDASLLILWSLWEGSERRCMNWAICNKSIIWGGWELLILCIALSGGVDVSIMTSPQFKLQKRTKSSHLTLTTNFSTNRKSSFRQLRSTFLNDIQLQFDIVVTYGTFPFPHLIMNYQS